VDGPERERVLFKVLLVSSGLVGVVKCVWEERLESRLRFVKWFPPSEYLKIYKGLDCY
jgi:hypothetical protein